MSGMYEELQQQEADDSESQKNAEENAEEDGQNQSEEAVAAEEAAQGLTTAAVRMAGDLTIGKESADVDGLLAPNIGDFPKPRPKRAPEVPQLERRNWLLHNHFMRRETDACKSLIEEQLDETSDCCEYALYMKGLLLRQEGKIQESLDVLQQCAMMNHQNVDYVKQIARSLFLLGKQKNALDVLNEALKITDTDWEIYYWKGLCYYHTKEFTKAKEVLQQAIKVGKHERILLLVAKIFTEENDLMGAIEAYKRALELSPENPDILTKLGLLYLKTDSYQQAFEALGRALRGSMMQQHADFDVALTKYRVAAVEMPDNAQLWSNIGMCFFGKKKYVAAISCLKRANYLAPFDWKILYNLGVVHLAMSQYASAFHFISAAINIQPNVGSLFMALAVALTNLEDTKNAQQAYERGLLLDKKDPNMALNYAIFLLKQGDRAKSVELFTVFETRLHNVRDSKTGQLRIDTEVLEMAEKFRAMMASGTSDSQSDKKPAAEPTPAHLKRDEFDSEQISLPPNTASSEGREDRDRGGLSTAASRQTTLTLSSEPKIAMEGSSVDSVSSRFMKE